MNGEARLARDRIGDAGAGLATLEFNCPEGGAAFIGRTISEGAYPAAAARYYAMDLYLDAAAEAEGSAMSPVFLNARIHALNLGGSIPPAGTNCLVMNVGDRWIFTYG